MQFIITGLIVFNVRLTHARHFAHAFRFGFEFRQSPQQSRSIRVIDLGITHEIFANFEAFFKRPLFVTYHALHILSLTAQKLPDDARIALR
jgi:hypothetical protein